MTSSSTNHLHGLKVAVITVVLISFLSSHHPSKSVMGAAAGYPSESDQKLQERKKMVLGSKPPGCVNKCLNCRPCMATLVIPPRQKKGLRDSNSHGEDDNYYLLLWKCRCGNKLFQP